LGGETTLCKITPFLGNQRIYSSAASLSLAHLIPQSGNISRIFYQPNPNHDDIANEFYFNYTAPWIVHAQYQFVQLMEITGNGRFNFALIRMILIIWKTKNNYLYNSHIFF